MPPADRASPHSEAGFTLIELLIVGALGMIVLGGAFAVLESSIDRQSRTAEDSVEVDRARTAMEAITREVRQASGAVIATPSVLSVRTWVNRTSCGGAASAGASIECRVTYACTAEACAREETEPDVAPSGAGARQVLNRISNADSVFGYEPSTADPRFVSIEFELIDGEGETVTVAGGSALRNAGGA